MPPQGGEGGLSRHVAIEIDHLETIVGLLIDAGLAPFQATLAGETRLIEDRYDPLDFGIGTVFVTDPDENVVEFVQRGRGVLGLTA